MATADGTTAGSAAPSVAVLDRMPVRFLITGALIAGLILIGLAMDAGASLNRQDAYLLLTFPASLLFQIFINRRPIRALWVRDAPPFRLDRIVIALALLVAIAPVVALVRQLRHQEWIFALYAALAIGGAVAAAYAIRAMTRTTFRQLGLCLATAGVIGLIFDLGIDVTGVFSVHFTEPITRHGLDIGLGYFFLYLPAVFMVEEVFFRGAIDSYIHRPGERTGWPSWLSALYVSVLWGIWHLPVVYPEMSLPRAIIYVLPLQIAVGIPLSLWWRRSGNLTVTGTTHAFIDAVRNATSGLP